MELLTEDDLKYMNVADVCSIRKSLNKTLSKLRKDMKRFRCYREDVIYYKQHLEFSTIVDRAISRKVRHP